MGKIFGLDFGTSNSTLSLNCDGNVSLLGIDPFNKENTILKSVLYYEEEHKKFYIGQQAVDLYLENDACGRYVQSIKSFLPNKGFEITEIGRKTYKLEQLIAIILRQIKTRGEKLAGEEINDVVLGRPVVFSEDEEIDLLAENRLLSAAQLAGFKNIHMQLEPIAAALSYESKLQEGEEKLVLVGDIGGGTSDFTIVKATGGKQNIKSDRKEDILSTGGVYIGGNTFDSSIMWEKVTKYFGRHVKLTSMYSNKDRCDEKIGIPISIFKQLCKWHYIPRLRTPKMMEDIRRYKYEADDKNSVENLENLIKDNYGYVLFKSIEKAKCDLSFLTESMISFKEKKLKIEEKLTIQEFENIIHPEVLKIESCVESAMRDAGVKAVNIDVIFLTGGSSNIPCIKNIFESKFGKEKLMQVDVFTSVAHGLGLSGYQYI